MSIKLLLNNVAQPPKKRMWIGYIPMDSGLLAGEDPAGDGITDPIQLGEEFNYQIMEYGINNGTLIEMDPQPFHTYGIFIPDGGFACIVLPEGWYAAFDDGNGNEVTFSQGNGVNGEYAQEGMMMKELVNGVQYYMFGIIFNVEGNIKLHVDTI